MCIDVGHMCTLPHRLNWAPKPFVQRTIRDSKGLGRIGRKLWVNVWFTRILPWSWEIIELIIEYRGLFIVLEDIRRWIGGVCNDIEMNVQWHWNECAMILKWLPEGVCILLKVTIQWNVHYLLNFTGLSVYWMFTCSENLTEL